MEGVHKKSFWSLFGSSSKKTSIGGTGEEASSSAKSPTHSPVSAPALSSANNGDSSPPPSPSKRQEMNSAKIGEL